MFSIFCLFFFSSFVFIESLHRSFAVPNGNLIFESVVSFPMQIFTGGSHGGGATLMS